MSEAGAQAAIRQGDPFSYPACVRSSHHCQHLLTQFIRLHHRTSQNIQVECAQGSSPERTTTRYQVGYHATAYDRSCMSLVEPGPFYILRLDVICALVLETWDFLVESCLRLHIVSDCWLRIQVPPSAFAA